MSCNIFGTTITLTRGDTFTARIDITDAAGEPYTPGKGDTVRFAMKASYADIRPLLVVDIPVDTMLLTLRPEDTKDLAFGKYVYDIQLTRANGEVDTFITKAKLNLSEEVD